MPAYQDQNTKKWYCSFYYTNWQGERKLKKKRGFKLKRDAEEWERDFKAERKPTLDMSFDTFIDVYLADMDARLRETTMDNKRNLIDTKIRPYFKNHKVNEIEATHIRHWQAELITSEKKYAPTYLKTINNQMSAIFNYAVKYYDLPKNPVRQAGSMGKKKADEFTFWTLDEFEQFIAAVDKPGMKLAFEVMFWTGLRVGECIALTPKDILPDKIIDVNKTSTRKDGEDQVYDPKTTKSARKVPIPDFLYDEIHAYMKALYGLEDHHKIFYFTKSALNKNLDYYAARAGVERIRVHDLRHSHASLLIEMGYEILLVSERLGHENVETTWNTYAHLYPNKQRQLADDLQKLRKIDANSEGDIV